jgi:hypothetical protein
MQLKAFEKWSQPQILWMSSSFLMLGISQNVALLMLGSLHWVLIWGFCNKIEQMNFCFLIRGMQISLWEKVSYEKFSFIYETEILYLPSFYYSTLKIMPFSK